jgi:hypothetical protein
MYGTIDEILRLDYQKRCSVGNGAKRYEQKITLNMA